MFLISLYDNFYFFHPHLIFLHYKALQNEEYAKKNGNDREYNLVCGTGVYDGYPTKEEYLSKFGPWSPDDENTRDKYYEKLPVEAAGNLYLKA